MTDLRTAEMIKYASNAFLATRISFINEISNICEAVGADVTEVAQGMGFDHRIGHHFLQAGVGYGGSCFPKDVKALAHIAEDHNVNPQTLNSVMSVNDYQRKRIMEKVAEELGDLKGKKVALLGLAFKENTDDLRESPAMAIAEHLLKGGANVYAYDPVAMENAEKELPGLNFCNNSYEAVNGAEALVIATPWNEFKNLNMEKILKAMNGNILIDGRNMFLPERMKELGFKYRGVGRGYKGEGVMMEPATKILQ
jgi:UDPglucose 6-dehydrogenase